jgi:ATP-dependent Clp protease ATP-binding subunit ClpC
MKTRLILTFNSLYCNISPSRYLKKYYFRGGHVNIDKVRLDLLQKIIGQDHAIEAIMPALTLANEKLNDPKRPLGSFLFLGPTGVGKSELPRSLARLLHGDESSAVVINCTEYKGYHDVAKLVGAPPGYVGHDMTPFLTQEKLEGDMTIVIFEEIEKADEALYDLLLEIVNKAVLVTGRGYELSFKNCLIFLTSNIGSRQYFEENNRNIGFKEISIHSSRTDLYLRACKNYFNPEFMGRFDEIVIFNDLMMEHFAKILDQFLSDTRVRFSMRGVDLKINKSVNKFLLMKTDCSSYGARPLKQTIKKYLEYPLAKQLEDGKFSGIIEVFMDKLGNVNFLKNNELNSAFA